MTLIALATYGADRAEILTDSLTYKRNVGKLRNASKCQVLPHIDAAILSRGDSAFGVEATSILTHWSGAMSDTFDELLAAAPALLRDLDKGLNRPPSTPTSAAAVYLVGWSTADAQFRAYHFAQEDEFEPVLLEGLHSMPTSFMRRPSLLEVSRSRAESGESNFWEGWLAQPERAAPQDLDEWREVGEEARTRSQLDVLRVLVGGKLLHTTLRRGSSTTVELLQFDDTGAELEAMVAGTQHPIAQLGPCWCGSGKTLLACHLAKHYADGHPCDCGSGDPFDRCCSATPDS